MLKSRDEVPYIVDCTLIITAQNAEAAELAVESLEGTVRKTIGTIEEVHINDVNIEMKGHENG